MTVSICYYVQEADKVTRLPPSPPALSQEAGGASTMTLVSGGLSAQTPLTRSGEARDRAGRVVCSPRVCDLTTQSVPKSLTPGVLHSTCDRDGTQ